MRIDKWMTREVEKVKPLDSILRAREIMEKRRINQLPVVFRGEVVGIITDRDLRDAFPSVFADRKTIRTLPDPPPSSPPRGAASEKDRKSRPVATAAAMVARTSSSSGDRTHQTYLFANAVRRVETW